jgi:hypothetical protein
LCDEEYDPNYGGGFSKILQSLSRAKTRLPGPGKGFLQRVIV